MADVNSSSFSEGESKENAGVSSGSGGHLKEFLTVPVYKGEIPPLKNNKHNRRKSVDFAEPEVAVGNIPPALTICDDDDDFLLGNRGRGRPEEKLTYFGYTKRQWLTLIIFGISNIFATTVISLQAPFYPREAEEKGATASEYGLVFGCFQLTMFIMSPIYGSLVGKVNPRLMFNVGVFVTGTCAILFGFLDYIQDRTLFIALSFAVRIAQACGDSAFVTASFTIIALEFPDSVATTFAALETCSGLGLIVGPTVGGVLYQVGGFLLPFAVMGMLLFSSALATFFFLPGLRNQTTENKLAESAAPSGFGFLRLMRLPPVAISALSIVISSASIGFLAATLEPHLRDKFQLTPLYTGLVFIIDGGMYALSAPLWGRFCDQSSKPKYITLIGCILTFIAFLFIGPPPFMPFESILWITCGGLVIYGIGVGATLVSAFIQALSDAMSRGFPDDVSTYGLVSGMWTSSFALGAFIGPSIGGFLLDNFGFQQSSVYVLGSQGVMALLVTLYIITSACASPATNPREKEPLLAIVPNVDRIESPKPGSSKQAKSKYSGDMYGSF